MNRIQDVMLGMFLGFLVTAAIYAYKTLKPSMPSVLTEPVADLAREKPTRLDCKPILVYRDKVETKLGLPDIVTKDPDKHVVASAQVRPSDYPHTMTAVYDEKVGSVDMFLRQDPIPWIAFNRRAALGLAYGSKSDTDGFVTRLYGRTDLIQIKRMHAGLLADVDNAGGWYGGGFVEIRF